MRSRLNRTPMAKITRRLATMTTLAALLATSTASAAHRTAQPRDKEAIKEEARKVLGRESDTKRKPNADETASKGTWCVAIMSLRGPERDEAAPIALARVRTEGRLPDAFAERRASATIIAVGRFQSADDAEAKAELKRVQEMVVDGVNVYAQAFLCPPEAEPKIGAHPEYNLIRARETYGSSAIQTLQIGVYARDDMKEPTEKDMAEVRKHAEAAAIKLRQEGELAFYYHGPRRSMVTIGVFDLTDFDPQVPSYNSARLLAAKKRHPHNLYNGQGIREKNSQDRTSRIQPSSLVAIPDAPAGQEQPIQPQRGR